MIVVDERQFRSAVAKSLVADAKCIFIPRSSSTTGEVIRGERWGSASAHLVVCRRVVEDVVDSWDKRGRMVELGEGPWEILVEKEMTFLPKIGSSSSKWSIVEEDDR